MGGPLRQKSFAELAMPAGFDKRRAQRRQRNQAHRDIRTDEQDGMKPHGTG
jgi:hypothetical protein